MNLNLQRAEIHPDSWDSRVVSRRRRRARIGGTIVEVSRVVPMWCRDDPRSFENAKMAENDAREGRVRSRSCDLGEATFFFWCEGPTTSQTYCYSSQSSRAGYTDMARGKGKGKASQSSLRAAGILPLLKRPLEAVGDNIHTPGDFGLGARPPTRRKCTCAPCASSTQCTSSPVASRHRRRSSAKRWARRATAVWSRASPRARSSVGGVRVTSVWGQSHVRLGQRRQSVGDHNDRVQCESLKGL